MKESKNTTIEEALQKGSASVNLRGWVYRERKSNKFVFIVLRDESDIIQCVISKDKSPKIFEKAEKLTIESSVKVSGDLKEDNRAPTGYEVSVSDLEIIQRLEEKINQPLVALDYIDGFSVGYAQNAEKFRK